MITFSMCSQYLLKINMIDRCLERNRVDMIICVLGMGRHVPAMYNVKEF